MTRACMIGLACFLSTQLVWSKDFSKTYELVPGGQIFIENFLGDIKIKGFKGDSVEIIASKKGKDSDKVEILDNSTAYRIDIRLRPPQFPPGDMRVDFEVRVPKSVEYNFARIATFSGNVDISDVSGRLNSESVRGDIKLDNVRGLVSASCFSGNIEVDIAKAKERSNMRFSTISGNIEVTAPADLDALVDISCPSGMLRTDFPLDVQELRYGPGRSARGRLGAGMQILHMRSVTGRVNLIKK
jgi:hypothetical protein